jgi:hypothetical protein
MRKERDSGWGAAVPLAASAGPTVVSGGASDPMGVELQQGGKPTYGSASGACCVWPVPAASGNEDVSRSQAGGGLVPSAIRPAWMSRSCTAS